MGIPLNLDFTMGVAKPIDSRFVMTKAEMLAANDAVMPPVYGCWCSEDGRFYIYNKQNAMGAETGKFKPAPDSQDMVDINSQLSAYNSYSGELSSLRAELEAVKNSLKANNEVKTVTNLVFTNNEYRKDFLPDHEKSFFCSNMEFIYTAEYSAAGNDSIFVNGKTIALTTAHETGVSYTHTIKIAFEYGVLNIYEDNALIDTLSKDLLLLTFGLTLSNAETAQIDSLEYAMSYYEYNDIRVYSKNDFPITENYNGEIIYWTRQSQMGGSPMGAYQYSLSAMHSKAVYSIGNNRTGSFYYMFNVAWGGTSWTYSRDSFNVPRENVIEYMYTSEWDFSKVTHLQQMAVFSGNTNVTKDYQGNRDYVDNYLKRVQWDNVKWPEVEQQPQSSGGVVRNAPFHTFNTKSYGNLAQFGSMFQYVPKYSILSFVGNYSIESFGDISGWDVRNYIRFDELFSQCFNLQFVGDLGKWAMGKGNDMEYDPSNPTVIKNTFRYCFKLKGISSAISEWDVSKCKQLNGIFQAAMCIGDATLVSLWKWNTHNCQNFGEMFAYLTPTVTQGAVGKYTPANVREWGNIYDEYNDPNTSEERKEELEWQMLELNKAAIEVPRTDLSFIEKWDMASAIQIRDMCAYNPYLVNAGDLRLWNFGVTDSSQWTALGASGMFAYCTALETLKMPSIPRGVNVDKIVKGCTSLANIELNALNVEAISFEDCPLTKQSVLNLINAATGDVEITLKPSVYEAYAQDSDVVAALTAKAGSNINVTLATTE